VKTVLQVHSLAAAAGVIKEENGPAAQLVWAAAEEVRLPWLPSMVPVMKG